MARSRKRDKSHSNDSASAEEVTANLAPLKAILEETAANIRSLSQSDQPLAREVCTGLASVADQIWRYSQLIALEKDTAAQYILTNISQNLLKAATVASDHLSRLDEKAEAYTTAEAALQKVVIDDKLGSELAMNLSLAISQSLEIYRELIEIDKSLESLRREVTNASSDWSLDDDAPGVQAHLAWLGGGRQGFTTLASRYLISNGRYSASQAIALRDEAEEHLNQLEEVAQIATRLHARTLQNTQEILGGKQERYAELLKDLQAQRDVLQSQSSEITSTLIKSSNLLSENELADWAAYESLQQYRNIDQARYTLGSTVSRIWKRLDSKPQLTSNARQVVNEARKYTDELFDQLVQPEIEAAAGCSSAPKVAETVSRAKAAGTTTVVTATPTDFLRRQASITKTPQPVQTVIPERLDEIYQMVAAVAAYRYCSEKFMQGMTIDSVLGILLCMNKITPAERVTYATALATRVKDRSRQVEDTGEVTEAWKSTSVEFRHWINYPNGRGRFFKLVLQGKKQALGLAELFGITDEATLEAKNRYSKEKNKLGKG